MPNPTIEAEAITLDELRTGAFDRELSELWLISRVPASTAYGTGGERYARLLWSAAEFAKAHPGTPSIRAYKRLDAITRA